MDNSAFVSTAELVVVNFATAHSPGAVVWLNSEASGRPADFGAQRFSGWAIRGESSGYGILRGLPRLAGSLLGRDP